MNKVTRCKFMCVEAKEINNGGDKNVHDYKFNPIYDDSCAENKTFWEYTPSGTLSMECTVEQDFKVGTYYYIDISEAVIVNN